MKEENEKLKELRNANPFSVPEDYFESLTKEVMGRLPQRNNLVIGKKKRTPWNKAKPWVYLAAMFIAILIPLRLWINNPADKQEVPAAADYDQEILSDEYLQTVMDYSMIDDYALYQYLTNADSDISYN